MFERAERELVEMADIVIVPTPALAGRFEDWGADVRLVPHGVTLFPWQTQGGSDGGVKIGFVGTLDFRIDAEVLEHVAISEPNWNISLVGPVQRGFPEARLRRLPNLSILPPVPHAEVGYTLRRFSVGIMPYFDHPFYQGMSPLKLLEFFAAGKPVVARPTAALEPFSQWLCFATTPAEFLEQIRHVLSHDSADRAQERRQVAEANSWDLRHAQLVQLLEELS
ncbi:MAG: glycosyltransferase [Actinomycetota bacterium]|nr:glycosyltransferase [Actinomycetota bacterium]